MLFVDNKVGVHFVDSPGKHIIGLFISERGVYSEVVCSELHFNSFLRKHMHVASSKRYANSTSTKTSRGPRCSVCGEKRVTYPGMCCKKCSIETGLPTDPDERLKRDNDRKNSKVSIF